MCIMPIADAEGIHNFTLFEQPSYKYVNVLRVIRLNKLQCSENILKITLVTALLAPPNMS